VVQRLQRPRHFHRDLGTVDPGIWYLFQACSAHSKQGGIMSEPDILYPAIFVFTMMLIGIVLTVWEFTRIAKRAHPERNRHRHVATLASENTRNRAAKASGH
jgi:hypothetical protein